MKIRFTLLASLLLICGSNTFAATTATTFPVTATVVSSCNLTASGIAFGNYDQLSGTALDSTGSVTPTCSLGTPYTIALGNGLGLGSTPGLRKMVGPLASLLGYTIYSDSLRTVVWGDGTGGSSTVSGTGLGVAGLPIITYGRVLVNQAVIGGSYADTIVVTLTY